MNKWIVEIFLTWAPTAKPHELKTWHGHCKFNIYLQNFVYIPHLTLAKFLMKSAFSTNLFLIIQQFCTLGFFCAFFNYITTKSMYFAMKCYNESNTKKCFRNAWFFYNNFFFALFFALFIGICSRLQHSYFSKYIRACSNHPGCNSQLYSDISARLQYRYRKNSGRIWGQSVHFWANTIDSQPIISSPWTGISVIFTDFPW